MKKHFVIYLLVFALIVSMITPVCFAESFSNEEQEYINTVLPRYLTARGEPLSGTIQITQGHSIGGNPDAKLFFVLNGNNYIGRLTVGTVGNDFASSFIFDDNPDIRNLIISNEPFAISGITDRLLIAHTHTDIIPITGSKDEIVNYISNNSITLNNIYTLPNTQEINFSNIANPNIDTSGYTASINVPFVKNQYDGVSRWLCWAACLCSISRHRGGSTISPKGLYDALKAEYGGSPYGIELWVLRGFEHFGIHTADKYTTINWSTLYNKISSNRPVIFVIENTISGSAHAVICEAFIGGNGYAMYRFMDPNTDTDEDVFVTHTDANLRLDYFPYVCGNQNYNTVESVYYY